MRTRKNDKAEAKPEGRARLQFVKDLIKATQLTQDEVAGKLGITRQALWTALNKTDDMKLSTLFELMKACNYQISYIIVQNNYQISAVTPEMLQQEMFIDVTVSRIAPLLKAMKRYKVDPTSLMQDCGLSSESLRYYRRTDDIFISRLFQIVAAQNWSIKFFLRPVKEETFDCSIDSINTPTVYTEILFQNQMPLNNIR